MVAAMADAKVAVVEDPEEEEVEPAITAVNQDIYQETVLSQRMRCATSVRSQDIFLVSAQTEAMTAMEETAEHVTAVENLVTFQEAALRATRLVDLMDVVVVVVVAVAAVVLASTAAALTTGPVIALKRSVVLAAATRVGQSATAVVNTGTSPGTARRELDKLEESACTFPTN